MCAHLNESSWRRRCPKPISLARWVQRHQRRKVPRASPARRRRVADRRRNGQGLRLMWQTAKMNVHYWEFSVPAEIFICVSIFFAFTGLKDKRTTFTKSPGACSFSGCLLVDAWNLGVQIFELKIFKIIQHPRLALMSYWSLVPFTQNWTFARNEAARGVRNPATRETIRHMEDLYAFSISIAFPTCTSQNHVLQSSSRQNVALKSETCSKQE